MAKSLLFNNNISKGEDDTILDLLPVYDLVNTYSSWEEKVLTLEWKCDAKDDTIDYFKIQRDSTTKGEVKKKTYTDTNFSRWTTYTYKVTPYYINGKTGELASITLRSPRNIDNTIPTKVEKVLKTSVKEKVIYTTDKPYVVFMPCCSYYVGSTDDTEIIEVD